MKIGLTALTLGPACVLGVFFVKKKKNRLRLIVDCRKSERSVRSSATCGAVVWRRTVALSKSTPLVLPTERVLPCTTGALMLPTVSTGCVLSGRDFGFFSVCQGVRTSTYEVTEIEGVKVSPHQTLSARCVARYQWVVSWSLCFAQSANRARLNRQASLRHGVEMTDRGPPLVLSKQGQNAQTGHLFVCGQHWHCQRSVFTCSCSAE